ncbi:MAG: aldehyde dehydrogenase (NADP(+)) [Pseudolysinimonas sp.]
MMITTTDPSTGILTDTDIEATDDSQVATIAQTSDAAFRVLREHPRAWRAGLLRALAAGLEANRAELVAIARTETGLVTARLEGELTRSVTQLSMFADVVDEGSYLEATIDHAAQTPMGPGPDMRRMLVPIGPIAVFGSSNFPFAFSVPGGDTASALAAGNSVILKAHGSHPLTSRLAFDALNTAATAYGAPAGTLGIVYGQRAGATLVADPRVAAVGFTGSLATGRILLDIIEKREQPIPFYGELSSLNPLVVTPGAAAARAEAIAEGLFASVNGSAGQLCTKPGIAFVPAGPEGDGLVATIAALGHGAAPQPLLNSRILDAFSDIHGHLLDAPGVREIVASATGAEGFSVGAAVLEVDAADVTPAIAEEAFGPLIVLVRYRDFDEVARALTAVPNSLTATIHAEDDETDAIATLTDLFRDAVGRLVFNGYPTGVRVSWAQHHGGPWPATNSLHTSVGMTAVRRFLRPLAWQNAPQSALPIELQDSEAGIPRRVDGKLYLAS